MRSIMIVPLIGLICLGCGRNQPDKKRVDELADANTCGDAPQTTSLLGKPLYKPLPVPVIHLKNHAAAMADWQKDPKNVEKWIWYGRRTAYIGEYKESIDIFSQALKEFPAEARLYRHRGHRYLTLRSFDKAVADFLRASELMSGKADEIEPDGLPNERNIPLSTLHGNVWYHLGLAYYLKNEMESALNAYQKSLEVSGNDDMKVACQYWLYMILRRLDRHEDARLLLEPLKENLDIIENMAYYRLCLFFKGSLPLEQLKRNDEKLVDFMNDALGYGLGNWNFFNGRKSEAEAQWRYVIDHSNWAGFACIAAEADYVRYFSNYAQKDY